MRQGGGSGNGFDVVELFGRMMLLPMAMFVVSLETFARTLRQLPPIGESIAGMDLSNQIGAAATGGLHRQTQGVGSLAAGPPPVPLHWREERVMDTNLSDDMVKLVRFTIVNIERDKETIVKNGEKLVTESMTDDAFASWMIATHAHQPRSGNGDDPRQYLRVYYEVLKRWPQQTGKYEKRKVDALEGIREDLQKCIDK